MSDIFTDTLKGKPTSRPPVWFMRQAGRVLPSYQELKQQYSFWELMQNPDLAAKVTLLPVDDLGVDAAILFSDILVIPYAMGMGLDFTDNGPVFDKPLKNRQDPLKSLKPDPSKMEFVYKTIRRINLMKNPNTPLIGFCGAPLTVMLFMIQGLGTRSQFPDAEKFFFREKALTKKIVEQVTELSIQYALKQIKSGISAFQLFDTHAGMVPFTFYDEVFMPGVRKIAKAVKQTGTPFIFFPKGIGTGLMYLDEELFDFVSVDWQTPIETARKLIPRSIGIQGNLDPRMLFSDNKIIREELNKYLPFHQQEDKWIFNLGHGLMPGIPVENVQFVVDYIKEIFRRD